MVAIPETWLHSYLLLFFNSTFLKKEKKTKKGNKSIYDGIEKEKIERQKEKS